MVVSKTWSAQGASKSACALIVYPVQPVTGETQVMKRSIRILTPLVAMLLAVALMPADTFAQNPNFAGSWTLNADESNLGGGGAGGRGGGRMGSMTAPNMTITHEGNNLKITTTRQGRDGQSMEMVQKQYGAIRKP